MQLRDVLEYLRYNAPEIGRLRGRGDKLAAKVFRAYQYAYDHRTDVDAQNELIKIVEDYIRRDINVSEAAELARKYAHKVDADPIVIPDPMKIKHAVSSALRTRH